MALFWTPGVRNALYTFFIKSGHANPEGQGWWFTHDTEKISPLARFIYTEGVEAWESVKDYPNPKRAPEFNDKTILEMTLAGCVFSSKVCREIESQGGGNLYEAYFNKKFYKALCKIADDQRRGLMRLQVEAYYRGENALPLALIDKWGIVNGKFCTFKGYDKKGKDIWEPINPW